MHMGIETIHSALNPSILMRCINMYSYTEYAEQNGYFKSDFSCSIMEQSTLKISCHIHVTLQLIVS